MSQPLMIDESPQHEFSAQLSIETLEAGLTTQEASEQPQERTIRWHITLLVVMSLVMSTIQFVWYYVKRLVMSAVRIVWRGERLRRLLITLVIMICVALRTLGTEVAAPDNDNALDEPYRSLAHWLRDVKYLLELFLKYCAFNQGNLELQGDHLAIGQPTG